MKPITKLQRLYQQIPAFACKSGCSECCGVVPFAKVEWDRIEPKRLSCTLTCGYLADGRCSIYNERPFICRLFGTSSDPRLRCPHGCAPKQPLTAKQAEALNQQYLKLGGNRPAGWSVDLDAILDDLRKP